MQTSPLGLNGNQSFVFRIARHANDQADIVTCRSALGNRRVDLIESRKIGGQPGERDLGFDLLIATRSGQEDLGLLNRSVKRIAAGRCHLIARQPVSRCRSVVGGGSQAGCEDREHIAYLGGPSAEGGQVDSIRLAVNRQAQPG